MIQGFDGLSNYDQVNAGDGFYAGTQYDLEPPDQALAVGNGFVLEAVNNALAVYQTDGTLVVGPTPMNEFFRQTPEVYGLNGPYGPSFSDVRALYDASSGRFIVEEWGLAVDPVTGNYLDDSFIYLAISDTSDPTGTWSLYGINTTYDSTTGDSLYPDYTQLGADAHGIYLSSNMGSLFGFSPPHVNLYVIPKTSLYNGEAPPYFEIDAVPNAFSLAPANTPPGADYESAEGGVEYFLSSHNDTSIDNRLEVWALTNTGSLEDWQTAPPQLNLIDKTIICEQYAFPPFALQKDGPRPLSDYFGGFPVSPLDTDDNGVLNPVFAFGALWTAMNSAVLDTDGGARCGVCYFRILPSFKKHQLNAVIRNQGYTHVVGEDILYPSIGVNATGGAVLTFTLAGPDHYPSAAYLSFRNGIPHIAAAGAAPADGFTGYYYGVERWGDYSAAVADADGSIWIAQEYIPDTGVKPRTLFANWGTYISRIRP